MPKGLLVFGLAAALLGVIMIAVGGPAAPVIIFGLILAVVGGTMVIGQRRSAHSDRKHRG